jgi:hypothetical protein
MIEVREGTMKQAWEEADWLPYPIVRLCIYAAAEIILIVNVIGSVKYYLTYR